jgi:hypothetical protein
MVADDSADELGAVFVRPAPPMSEFIPDMSAVHGILYDGSKGKPNGFVASYGLFTGETNHRPGFGANLMSSKNPLMMLNPVYAASADSALGDEHYGFVWGSFDKDNVPGGIPYGKSLRQGEWNEVAGRYEPAASGQFSRIATAAEAFASATQTSKHGKPFGPLVGNPNMPDFAKMRVDAQGNMFWHPWEAPKWLKRPKGPARKAAINPIDARRAEARRAWDLEQSQLREQRAAVQAEQNARNAERERAAEAEAAVIRAGLTQGSSGFDVLGAEDALANQYIVVRVKRIDRAKLAAKLGGSKGQLASSALQVVNTMPKAVLDAALPIAKTKATDYGIDVDFSVSDVPPKLRQRAFSEFWPGLGIGIVLGGLGLAIVKGIGKLLPAKVG